MMNIGTQGLIALFLSACALGYLAWLAHRHFFGSKPTDTHSEPTPSDNDGESTPLDPVHPGRVHDHVCKYDQAEQRRTAHQVTPPIDMSNLPAADPSVTALLSSVSIPAIETALNELTGEVPFRLNGTAVKISSRNSHYKELEIAMQYLEQFYASIGVKTERHAYKVSGKTFFNLIAEFRGSENPEKVLILGGHLDSTAGWPWSSESVAPGADDDCSGTVGLMEIAKVLVRMQCGYTVRIVHFTCEEQGLYGSYAYSDAVARAKTDVIGMIEMDMVGYSGLPGHRVEIHDDVDKNGSHFLVETMARAAKQYGLSLNVVDTHNRAMANRSDHAGFLDHGYKAVLVSSEFTDEGFNPNYHKKTDRVKTLNLPYMAEVIRMVLAATIELAKCK